MDINGMPSCEYGFQAAKRVGIKNIFVSTDCSRIAEIGSKYSAHHIKRPSNLATPDSLTEDVLVHAYKEIYVCLRIFLRQITLYLVTFIVIKGPHI